MRIALSALIALALVSQAVSAGTNKDREVCERTKQQIREIEARMRNGYSAAQGIRYDERLRKLKDKRYRYCR